MASDSSDDGLGWLVAIGLGCYLAYITWWKDPEPPKTAPISVTESVARVPIGPLVTLSNGTEWRMVWGKLKGPRNARLAWVREDHTNNKQRIERESLTLYKINCETTGYVTLSVIDYDKSGKVLKQFDQFSKEDSYPPPGSIIENAIEGACLPQYDKL